MTKNLRGAHALRRTACVAVALASLGAMLPFRSATALVTVEREGVTEALVTKLSGRDPHVKLKIAAAHAPNVFV